MIRNPFSLKKMEYQAQQGMVVYRSPVCTPAKNTILI
jgi:hypothetical protein